MFFWRKTWNNRLRNIFIVLLIFFPTLEVFIHIRQAIASGTAYYPDYCSFLSCNTVGVGHTLQSIYLWLLPLYMLFIFSNDCIWDFESGYVNLIQAKMGKKKYIIENLKKSFWGASGIICIGLLLNLLISHIVFFGAAGDKYEDELILNTFYRFEIEHKLLTNIIFILLCSFVLGMVSMASTMMSISIKNIKIVYGFIFTLWIALCLKKNSVVLLFQPHSEYYLDTLIPLFLEVVFLFGVICLIFYLKETKFEKKNI